MLDLDYAEDSEAETDMNVVMNDAGAYIEVQGNGSKVMRSAQESTRCSLARAGIAELIGHQRAALGIGR